ncbi:MAG: MerR family transcriptional regulator [Lachnospiraceae bacterium]|nr:MerR family transcriptional regulator [Lachnospiraceae bacterium]
MYKIGELSRLCHIPVKTLRYYDSEGLLVPDEIDRVTGYRYYSAAQLADCYRIISLKELGFSLEEIKKHMHASSDADILELVENKYTELTEKSKELSLQMKKLYHIKKSISEGAKTMFHVSIRSGDTINVIFQRKIYAAKTDAEEMVKHIKAALPQHMIGERTIIVNYEMEYRESDLDLAACVEVTGKFINNLEYEEMTFTFSGEFATLACRREQLDDGYHAMLSQIHEIDYQIIGASYEIYYDDGTVELKIPVCKKVKCIDAPIERQTFENDEAVVGKWEIRDIVTSKEQFVYGNPKCPEARNSVWCELYFPEGGEPYWFLKGWTKGFLYLEATTPEPHIVAMPYIIESLNERTIMFLQIPRRYSDGSKDAVPQLLVFEKVSNQSILAKDIQISAN